MAYITGFFAFLKMLPEIMGYVRDIRKAYQDYQDEMQRAEMKKKLKAAVGQSFKDKNTSALEDLLHGTNSKAKPNP